MSAVVGVLVDVSFSMKKNIGGRVNQEGGSWARSIFEVVDNLIKHDVSSDNKVFAIGYGASPEPRVFDLLNTVDKSDTYSRNQNCFCYSISEKKEMLKEVLNLLKISGAPFIYDWATMDILLKNVIDVEVCLYSAMLKNNQVFTEEFVYRCLPVECRVRNLGTEAIRFTWWASWMSGSVGQNVTERIETGITESVREAIEKGLKLISKKEEMLHKLLHLLERNGAPYVRRWATMDLLLNTVADHEIELFFQMIEKDRLFRNEFVKNCLPKECKYESLTSQVIVGAQNTSFLWGIFVPSLKQDMDTRVRQASVESVREAIDKGLLLAWKNNVVKVGPHAFNSLDKASEILHGCIKEEKLTDEQVDKLMRTVEPFIYGPSTPMIEALNKAKELLAYPDFDEMQKVLFVLSDGEPTDGENPPVFADVNVVSCYITNSSILNPKRLYCTETQTWDDGAKFMFNLSSNIQTQNLPRTVFVKRGWKVDITNNQTKLFLQVNHPDLLDEVCSFARDVVCSQDALSDILASVNLDLYINKVNSGFGAKKQQGGTCYANASAAVMHLAMKRIVGREGGYPEFFALRQELTDNYSIHGAHTLGVLQEVCPRYRLRCKRTDIHGALKAIADKQPVLARFRLTSEEWNLFYQFYKHNPTGILTDKELDIRKRPPNAKLKGHAVVLTSFNSEGLNLMNSWGTEWANNGFFSVKNHKILGLEFIDVYWELSDLLKSEIEFYDREGPRIAANLLKSLKALNTATFKCPLCDKVSEVSKFHGKLVNATCPSCHRVFDTKKEDCHDLVLNMYLMSLCREKVRSRSADDKPQCNSQVQKEEEEELDDLWCCDMFIM